MSIWLQQPELTALNALSKNTLVELLDIRFEAFDDDSLTASMVVDPRTHQPYGLLHGGASVVLAETLGSTASYLCIDSTQFYCVGLEVNANHLRAVTSGWVTGTARPVHIGRTTQVWQIDMCNEAGQPTCVSRITMAVLAPQ